jgi:DNA-binding NarL/FixJ family response regulator
MSARSAGTRPVRVLVVDDQASFREVVRQALDGVDGFEVVGALPGAQELTAEVDRLHPDLVLLDVRMPGEDGATAASHLHRAHPELAVVLMSVFDREDVPDEVLDAGVGFLPKEDLGPAPLAELHRRLHPTDG